MARHRKTDDDETDIIAQVVDVPEPEFGEEPEEEFVLLADFLKDHAMSRQTDHHFAPMFRGMNPTDPTMEPVGPELSDVKLDTVKHYKPSVSRWLIALSLSAAVLAIAAFVLALYVYLNGCDCHYTFGPLAH